MSEPLLKPDLGDSDSIAQLPVPGAIPKNKANAPGNVPVLQFPTAGAPEISKYSHDFVFFQPIIMLTIHFYF